MDLNAFCTRRSGGWPRSRGLGRQDDAAAPRESAGARSDDATFWDPAHKRARCIKGRDLRLPRSFIIGLRAAQAGIEPPGSDVGLVENLGRQGWSSLLFQVCDRASSGTRRARPPLGFCWWRAHEARLRGGGATGAVDRHGSLPLSRLRGEQRVLRSAADARGQRVAGGGTNRRTTRLDARRRGDGGADV